MWHDVRETRRDARAIDDGAQGAVVAGANVGWMAYFRRNSQGGHSEADDK
jgi:hypothetical protein